MFVGLGGKEGKKENLVRADGDDDDVDGGDFSRSKLIEEKSKRHRRI